MPVPERGAIDISIRNYDRQSRCSGIFATRLDRWHRFFGCTRRIFSLLPGERTCKRFVWYLSINAKVQSGRSLVTPCYYKTGSRPRLSVPIRLVFRDEFQSARLPEASQETQEGEKAIMLRYCHSTLSSGAAKAAETLSACRVQDKPRTPVTRAFFLPYPSPSPSPVPVPVPGPP